MKSKEVKFLLNQNKSDLVFLLGNGINRYYKTSKTWNELLLELWKDFSFTTLSKIPSGISITEIYDILDLENRDTDKIDNRLQRKIQSEFLSIHVNEKPKTILDTIKSYNSPILTTNFDDFISRYYNMNYYSFSGRKLTDFYPWESYYSASQFSHPLDGHSVWHVNGMVKYHRSIKLGMAHYMGNVNRAKTLLHGNLKEIEFDGKNQKNWPGMNTWLHILFNKSLFVIGLGLDENEIFLRWLLIERAKYFRQFKQRKKQSWYIKQKDEKNEGKDFYLRSLGFDIIEMDSYEDIYNNIWL